MGTSPGLGISKANSKMRAFAIVLLAVAAINADADADAYTLGQVYTGRTNGGVITGVVSGLGDVGNRPVSYAAHITPSVHNVATYASHPAYTTPVSSVYSNVFPNVYSGVHHFGKREAEADAQVHTNGVFNHGVAGVYNTAGLYNTAGVHPYNTFAHSVVPNVNTVASTYTTPVTCLYNNVVPNVYSGVHHFGQYGKREAEAEADAQVYTNGVFNTGVAGVYNTAGLYNTAGVYPYNTVAGVSAVSPITTVGVPTVRTLAHSVVPTVNTVASAHTTPVTSLYNNVVPNVYSGLHHFGKREAEAEADAQVYTNGVFNTGVAGLYNTAGVYNTAGLYNTAGVYPYNTVAHSVVPSVRTATPAVYSG